MEESGKGWPHLRVKRANATVWFNAFQNIVAKKFSEDNPEKRRWVFRGQEDKDRRLISSLGRIVSENNVPPEYADHIEKIALQEFRMYSNPILERRNPPHDDDSFSWRAIMQHHGAPTRLLDWSYSPYVALFFAVKEGWKHEKGKDGALWCLEFYELERIMRKRFPGYPNLYSRANDAGVVVNRTIRQTRRMLSQSWVYTYSNVIKADHEKAVAEIAGEDGLKGFFWKVVVPREFKPSLLVRLQDMGISAKSIYHGLDGAGGTVREVVRLMAHFKDR